MILDNSSLLLLAAPAAMLLVSLATIRQGGLSPAVLERLGIGAAAFGIYVAAMGVALLVNHGPMQSSLMGSQVPGFAVQLGPLNTAIFLVLALLAFQFVRLSRRLAGYHRQRVLLGRLSATVAALQCAVLTGNMGISIVAAILAGLTLHEMSVYYRERRGTPVSAATAQLETARGL